MEDNKLPEDYKSGYVAVAGKPNVGKSTLMNRLLKQAVAAVSPKAQTTRRNQLGILTNDRAQIIFVDTPGIHQPHHKLGERMNNEARSAVSDADVVLVIFDMTQNPSDEDRQVADHLEELESKADLIVGLNKVDLVSSEDLSRRRQSYTSLLPLAEAVEISAVSGQGLDELMELLVQKLPHGPQYYPPDMVTDSYERDIAADMIRAAAMDLLHEEVPYSIAIRVDEYKERGDKGAYIAATIFVDRESQKGIVIGKGGSKLKSIGTRARREIEDMSGRKVYLDLRVKVLPGWRENDAALERFGYGKKRT
jgi:GTP-binding protein Era